MKKVFILVLLIGIIISISSCGSVKNMAALSYLEGDWNIVELNGAALVPTTGAEVPNIGFNTATGQVYGYSGCNRMSGSFDVTAKPGTIDLSRLVSTRMACPDMTTEQNVLNTLSQVSGYKKRLNGDLELLNASGRTVAVLEKREMNSGLNDLDGKWRITQVDGVTVNSSMETKPFIEFDTDQKKIHGNAGCNTINGSFTYNSSNPRSISFPASAITMMACLELELESKILKALENVRVYDKLSEGIGLYDAQGNLVLLLEK